MGRVHKEDFGRRAGGTSLGVIGLMTGILVTLLILVVILVTRRGGDGSRPAPPGPSPTRPAPVDAVGQTSQRTELPAPHKSPKPIDDPERIKETLREGKTYSVVLKAGLDARVEDKAWGVKQVVNLAYAAEMHVDRTVETNDGKRVVELRHFLTSRNVKLLYDVEGVTIELGAPGVLLLGVLDSLRPGATEVVALAKPIAESILGYGAQAAGQSAATKAVAHVDTLSGKRVRITYVDGFGVKAIEPVGCTLTRDEFDFVAGTAVLSDCYVWDLKKAVGERWKVDGAQLSGLLDPSLRGAAEGEIGFIREADGQENGRRFAVLRVEDGDLTVNSSDASTRRIGNLTPRGAMRYSLADRVVEHARLVGRFQIDEVSTNHVLFETRFKSRPTLAVEYACSVR